MIVAPKICFILSPGPVLGGAEFYVIELSKSINKNEDDLCTVLYSHNKGVGRICASESVPSKWLGASIFTSVVELSVYVRANKPEYIVSNGYHSNFILSLFKIFFLVFSIGQINIKLFCIEHGWVSNNWMGKFMTFLDKFTLSLFDGVVIVEPEMRKDIFLQNNVKYIPSFSGKILPNINNIAASNKSKDKLIVGIGRLAKEKQFDCFLEIAQEIYLRDKEYRFLILGDGPELSYLKKMRRQLSLDSVVIFKGYVDDVGKYLAMAKGLLLCSSAEGCPRVVLEAMLGGVMVFASPVGHIPSLLANKRGVLLDKTLCPVDCAIKIDSALNDASFSNIVNDAYIYASTVYSLENTTKLFLEFVKIKHGDE